MGKIGSSDKQLKNVDSDVMDYINGYTLFYTVFGVSGEGQVDHPLDTF